MTAVSQPHDAAIPYSKTRIAGMALYWAWVFIMFNSIQPYAFVEEKRLALYLGLIISLLAATVMLAFLALESKGPESWRSNKPVLFGSVLAMTAGAILTPFSDAGSSAGMLVLTVSAILTGSGSGALLIAWSEAQSPLGGRATLCELCPAFLLAFALSLALALAPAPVAIAASALMPGASLALLMKSPAGAFRPKTGPSTGAEEGYPPVRLSRETLTLFAKALVGAALIGFLEGFFDVFTGFSTFNVGDEYGVFLFMAGVLSFALMGLIVWRFARDSIFLAYRFTMLLLCLGFLVVPFLSETILGISSIIFAGYTCFNVVLLAVSADVSRSFRINRSRCAAVSFALLYLGEAVGEAASHGLQSVIEGVPNLGVITLVAVSLLFISSLFLFTEVDLIKIGIGEVDLAVTNPRLQREGAEKGHVGMDGGEDAKASPVPPDPAAIIAERYKLSPRESEVLPLLLEGRTISRMMETLFISQGTVSTHIRHIYQKTGSANRQELIDLALRISEEAADAAAGAAQGERS